MKNRMKLIGTISLCIFMVCMSFLLTSCEDKTETQTERYNVVFETNGGSSISNIINGIEVPNTVITTFNGYTFEGWYLTSNFADSSKVTLPYILSANIMLYAKWTKNTIPDPDPGRYNVVFETNGGSAVSNIINGIEVPNTVITTFNGYTFEGWYLTSNFADSSKVTLPYILSANIMLYAKWTKNTIPDPADGLFGFEEKADGYYVSKNKTDRVNLIIPQTYNGKNVTGINARVFEGNIDIVSISLPTTIKFIGANAFADCMNLKNIALPQNLVTIGSGAFLNCQKLTYMAINNDVKNLGTGIFVGCKSISELTIPDSIKLPYLFSDVLSMPESLVKVSLSPGASKVITEAFAFCGYLKEIDVSGATSIGDKAFQMCTNLETLKVPYMDKFISYYFGADSATNNGSACANLKNIEVGSVKKSIGEYAFKGLSKLESINIKEGIESIGKNAFDYCVKLKAIEVPNSVTEIGAAAFRSCTALESASLGNNLTVIANELFYYCYSLKDCFFSSNITEIGSGAFGECRTLVCDLTKLKNVTKIGNNAFNNCVKNIGALDLSSCISLGDNAFLNNLQLNGILKLSDNLTVIPENAFGGCKLLGGKLQLPANLADIMAGAFNGCESFSGVLDLPDNLTSVGLSAFRGCKGFSSVNFPTLKPFVINTQAFENCTFTKLFIPSNTTQIDNLAFNGCESLEELSIPFIGNNANGSQLASIFRGKDTTWNGLPGSLIKIVIRDSTVVPKNGFINCRFIKTIVFEKTLTQILPGAFKNCISLSGNFIYPASILEVADEVFYNCAKLKIIPHDDIVSIGISAFENCTLSEFELPKSLTNIAYGAFSYSAISQIVFPEGLKEIGDMAFANCQNITEVTLPESLLKFRTNAFFGCSNLETVYFNAINCSVTVSAKPSYDQPEPPPFSGCYKFNNLYIGANVLTIDEDLCNRLMQPKNLFYNAENATNVFNLNFLNKVGFEKLVIGDGVLSIPARAFYNMGGLTDITIGKNVKTIGDFAFNSQDSKISSLVIPDSVQTIGSDLLHMKTPLESITLPFTGNAIGGKHQMFRYIFGITEDKYNIPKTLKTVTVTKAVGESAFRNTNFKFELIITNTCSVFHGTSLKGTDNLENPITVTVLPGNPYMSVIDNYYLVMNSGLLVYFGGRGIVTDVIIPSSVTVIDSYAFYRSNIISITMPEGLLEIGEYAFYYSMKIKEIIIPASATSIGQYAFYGCGLAEKAVVGSKVLGSNLLEIGNRAFSSTSKLANYYFWGVVPPKKGGFVFPENVGFNLYVPKGCGPAYSSAFDLHVIDTLV